MSSSDKGGVDSMYIPAVPVGNVCRKGIDNLVELSESEGRPVGEVCHAVLEQLVPGERVSDLQERIPRRLGSSTLRRDIAVSSK